VEADFGLLNAVGSNPHAERIASWKRVEAPL